MRVAFFRGDIVDSVIEIEPDQIDRFLTAYGCDHYLVAPIEDAGLRALGEGAKLAGAASRLVPGSRQVDRARVPAITPAAAVPPVEVAAAVADREAAIEARTDELAAGLDEAGGK